MIARADISQYLCELERAGLIRPLDRHFALRLGRPSGSHDAVILAAAWVSHRLGQGHVCADLRQVGGRPLFADDRVPPFPTPPTETWCGLLRASSAVGQPGDYRPLILDQAGRLYLQRYYNHERRVAEGILSRAEFAEGIDLGTLRAGLERLFPDDSSAAPSFRLGVEGQKRAAAIAVLRRFAVISGGPGTGKTTTVIKLLALLLEQDASACVALAAPTGKAAARLSEAIRDKKAELLRAGQLESGTAEAVPEQASTLHRLLGSRPDSLKFRHDAANPLPVDILVIDEASMIDLPLMSRLLDALPADTRLILLGDMHQLASVEAGQVFGDICGRTERSGYSHALTDALGKLGLPLDKTVEPQARRTLDDSIAVLHESFRFGSDSGIGNLAKAVNAGDHPSAVRLLDDCSCGDIAWREVGREALPSLVAEEITPRFGAYLEAGTAQQALAAFGDFRVLCALREGPFGVEWINWLIEEELSRRRWIRPDERWYRGRPVMITRNDYGLRLFNGDIGLIWPDDEHGGAMRALFPSGDGAIRKLLPSRLPDHETVFAMTVHKSQGSEFDRVVLLLPDQSSPVVTRELIYTGLTRARKRVLLCGTRGAFGEAIGKTVERSGGLADRLAPP